MRKVMASWKSSSVLNLGTVLVMLSGCFTVGPDYQKPDVPVPSEWSRELRAGVSASQPDPERLERWWNTLKDPDLTDLIERAVEGNRDLDQARARIREARARRGIAAAEWFPKVDGTGSAATRWSSEQTGPGERTELYALGFDASWEIDVFGGVRRSVEAADAVIEARQADYDDVLVSLLGEVAVNYVDLRTFQARLQVAESNLQTQAQTLQLTEWRLEAGLVSRLDVEQAKTNLENTRAQLPSLRSGIERAKNRLALLLGLAPGALKGQLATQKPIPVTPLEVAVGLPAELLRRRPDVRRAERELAAQTARIGVATADLYPKFTLPGTIGLEALAAHNLFRSGSRVASVGGTFSWAIFRGGAIRQNIEAQDALQEQALAKYEAVILTALEDVENALVNYAEEHQRRTALSRATEAAQVAAALARNQYASGLSDFQSVLDTERSLLSFQEQLVQSEGQVVSDLISLYKALGGGWTPGRPGQP